MSENNCALVSKISSDISVIISEKEIKSKIFDLSR